MRLGVVVGVGFELHRNLLSTMLMAVHLESAWVLSVRTCLMGVGVRVVVWVCGCMFVDTFDVPCHFPQVRKQLHHCHTAKCPRNRSLRVPNL